MLSDTRDGRLLINEAAYVIISENAPQELPLYVNTRDRYFADPDDFLTVPESRDDPLGFGSGSILDTFSQAVFPVLAPILVLLLNEATKAFGKDAGVKTLNWVSGLFRKREEQKNLGTQPVFTPNQLAAIEKQISAIAENEAERLGLNKSQVLVVRDAVITKLALSNS